MCLLRLFIRHILTGIYLCESSICFLLYDIRNPGVFLEDILIFHVILLLTINRHSTLQAALCPFGAW